MTPYWLVSIYQHHGGACCLHLQGPSNHWTTWALNMETVNSSAMLVNLPIGTVSYTPSKLEWLSVFNERGANLRACVRSRTPVRRSCSLRFLSFLTDATTWSNKMQFSRAIWSNRSTNIVSKLIYQPLVSWNLQDKRERERERGGGRERQTDR